MDKNESNKEDNPMRSDNQEDNKGDNVSREDMHEDRNDEDKMFSEQSNSSLDSRQSNREEPNERTEAEVGRAKREVHNSRRRNKRRPKRGVLKRRRSQIRRQVRQPKRSKRIAKRIRDVSIASGLSSENGCISPFCKYCGHRCCLRRIKTKPRQKNYRKHIIKRSLKKRTAEVITRSEIVQVGSRCAMFSPLYIKSNDSPEADRAPVSDLGYQAITPEMIQETMLKLMKWRQFVMTGAILEHIVRSYPVNRNIEELLKELTEKLLISVKVGFLIQKDIDLWTLREPFSRRKLLQSHVTLFWKIHGDTMRPVTKKTRVANDTPKSDKTNAEIDV